MENFDLLALQHELAESAAGAVIRRVQPAPEPDNSGILFKLDGPGAGWLLISPGPLYPCLLPLSTGRKPEGREEHPTSFLMLLRKYLDGARVTSLRKVRLERIFLLTAEKTMSGGVKAPTTLVIELTGKSAVLALINEKGNLLGANRQPSGRLLPGAPYSPPRRAPGRERLNPFAASPGGDQRDELETYLKTSLERFGPTSDRKGLYRSLISALEGFGPVYASELAARLLEPPKTTDSALEAWDRFLGQLEQLQAPGEHGGYLHRPHDPDAALPVAAAIPLEASRLTGQWNMETCATLAQAAARCREEILGRAGFDQRRRSLIKDLGRAAKKNKRLRARLEADRARFKTADNFLRYGELLTGALDTYAGLRKKRGLDKLKVTDFYQPDTPEVEIPLNPKLTLVQNVQSFFRRHRRAERGLESVEERFKPLQTEAAYIEELLSAAELAENAEELRATEEEARAAKLISTPQQKGPAARSSGDSGALTGVITFTSSDGMEILVGRSARGNDQVTFKHAGPEDFWLHAGGMPGSHVVVRNPKRLEKLPPKTLDQASGLAAWYSKGRRSTSVDIHLTRRKWVKRPRGGAPGLVTLKRFETVLARPVSPGEIHPTADDSTSR